MDSTQGIADLAAKIAASNGLDLVDLELFRAGRRRILRVYVGKRGGVGIDDCAKVSRDLSALLDAEGLMGEETYNLEVSSPGLDRPFKTLQDYRRNLGRFVRVSTREPVEGKRVLVGKLADVGEASITLDEDGDTRSIPLEAILQAKVDIRIS